MKEWAEYSITIEDVFFKGKNEGFKRMALQLEFIPNRTQKNYVWYSKYIDPREFLRRQLVVIKFAKKAAPEDPGDIVDIRWIVRSLGHLNEDIAEIHRRCPQTEIVRIMRVNAADLNLMRSEMSDGQEAFAEENREVILASSNDGKEERTFVIEISRQEEGRYVRNANQKVPLSSNVKD